MAEACSQGGCAEPRFAKGLCKTHYYRQYHAANREKHNARARANHQANRQERNRQARARYAANPGAYKARVRKWRRTHPEQYRASSQRYREANLGRLHEYDAQPERRAKKAARKRLRHAEIKLEALLTYGDGSCAACGYRPDNIFELEVHHVNHDGAAHRAAITGLRRGGSFQFYKALQEAKWPTDVPLETLCANCHKKRTIAHGKVISIN